MTIFEVIRAEVTAEQAARLYGLKFDRAGRGFCPWHNDGKHAALQFFPDGGCYCHSCHEYGDATEITSQMLGITPMRAAWQLYRDFKLRQPVDKRQNPETQIRMKRQRDERAEQAERYGYLVDVIRDADGRLEQYGVEGAESDEFWMILEARCRAEEQMYLIWEEMKHGRT